MKLGIIRLYTGESGKLGYYNMQELGLAKELVKHGIEVYIFLLIDRKKQSQIKTIEIQRNIKIVYIPALRLGTHGIINPKILKSFNLNIVQISSDIQINTKRMINWCVNSNIPVYTYIGTIRSDSNKFIKKLVTEIIVKYNISAMKKVMNVAKTPSVYEDLVKKSVENVRLIPVGLDYKNLMNIENFDRKILREKFQIDIDKKVLIFVGRLEEYKKPMLLPKILRKLVETDNKYHLIVVGKGILQDKIMNKIKEYNLNNNFTYIENIPNAEIGMLYKLSDIFINLNDKEIYGMSILEAMYCGCPVVAKNAPGPCFIIDDKKNGVIVNSYDIDEWLNKILYASDNRTILSEESIKKINEKLTWSVIANDFIKLYDDIKIRI